MPEDIHDTHRGLRLIDLLRPHWKALTIALVAVLGETLTVIHDVIRHADVIFVINDFALVEQGTHEELLARNGLYADTHRIQNPDDATIAAAPQRVAS